MDSDGKRELMKTWSEPQTPWGSLGFWQQVFRKPSWSRGRNLTSVMDSGVLQRSEKARKVPLLPSFGGCVYVLLFSFFLV